MSLFDDKSVLVLGGSRGTDGAMVRRFALEGAAVPFTFAGSKQLLEWPSHAAIGS